jgi:hypothetical protein
MTCRLKILDSKFLIVNDKLLVSGKYAFLGSVMNVSRENHEYYLIDSAGDNRNFLISGLMCFWKIQAYQF